MTTVFDRCHIMSDARDILAFNGSDTERASEFSEFAVAHPKLYGILISGRCDLRHLEIMFTNMDRIESGKVTLEQASKDVSDDLNATYIESVLPKPTAEQIRKASEAEEQQKATLNQEDDGGGQENAKKRARSHK